MQLDQPKEGSKRLRTSYASSIISVSLVLFMLGLLGLLILDANKISDYVKEHIQLNVYLQENVSQQDLNMFLQALNESDFVRSARYVSKEEALDSLKKELGEGAMGMIDNNPLPATIDINLKASYANPDSLKRIKDQLSSIRLVQEVAYQQTEIKKMNENFRTVAMVILIFCALLLFVAVVLINNTIRLAMYSKRFLIKSMQLVGATKGFIRWPFLKKGFVHGFYAGIISSILVGVIIYFIHTQFPDFGQLSDLKLIGILFGGMIAIGILLSGLSTFFAINRYLRLHGDELYL
ncbi:MAG: ABC transporter permease [Bacteroidetes bacterium]|nr:ABC transporter permease [Bacteroidota bacterium]